jgi:hypothetical protein
MTDGFSFPYYAGMHNIYSGKAMFLFILYKIFSFVAYFDDGFSTFLSYTDIILIDSKVI